MTTSPGSSPPAYKPVQDKETARAILSGSKKDAAEAPTVKKLKPSSGTAPPVVRDLTDALEKADKKTKRKPPPPRKKDPLPEPHPDCARCKAPKVKGPNTTQAWHEFKKKFELEHPDLDKFELDVEARKHYVPQSGKAKSFERIYREQYLARHPGERTKYSPEELALRIREAYVNERFGRNETKKTVEVIAA